MPFTEPELEARDGDEIPGITSFIYRLNRYREPHEYSQSPDWKNPYFEIKELEKKLTSAKKYIEKDKEKHEEKVIDLNVQLENANRDIAKLQYDLTAEGMRADRYAGYNQKIIKFLVDHGAHADSCFWAELCASGRVEEQDKESDLCSCGWSQVESLLGMKDTVAEICRVIDSYR